VIHQIKDDLGATIDGVVAAWNVAGA